MRSPRLTAVLVAAVGFVAGSAVTAGLTDAVDPEIADTFGFAVSTPTGLVLLTYIADEFEFDRYFGERRPLGMVTDFSFSIMAAAVAGLFGTVALLGVLSPGLLLNSISGVIGFVGGIAAFFYTTREFLQLDER